MGVVTADADWPNISRARYPEPDIRMGDAHGAAFWPDPREYDKDRASEYRETRRNIKGQ